MPGYDPYTPLTPREAPAGEGAAQRRPMREAEYKAAMALMPGFVTYLPGSPDKRFARDMAYQAGAAGTITEKQAAYLRQMVWRYRRQIRGWEKLLRDMGGASDGNPVGDPGGEPPG